jgi:hypothetical protein
MQMAYADQHTHQMVSCSICLPVGTCCASGQHCKGECNVSWGMAV